MRLSKWSWKIRFVVQTENMKNYFWGVLGKNFNENIAQSIGTEVLNDS